MTTTAKTQGQAPAKTAARKPVVRSTAAASAAAKAAAQAAAKPVSTPDFTKRYKMLTGIDDGDFCTKVGLHLDNGYKLFGSPTATFNGKNVIVGQAVVLKKVPAKKKSGKKK
jgi:hypothetical protein